MTQELFNLIKTNKPNFETIPGGVELPEDYWKNYKFTDAIPNAISLMDGVDLIQNAIHTIDCDELIKYFEKNGNYAPVTIQGMQDIKDDNIGSNRITGFSPVLANMIYNQIRYSLPKNKICNAYSSTDWWQDDLSINWKYAGVSPMLRFMKYQKNGQHFPHYDAGFIYPNKPYRTLKSFVLYLTTNQSGATRFIEDTQSHIPVVLRNHADWDREPTEKEILHNILPIKGNMLVFDHRICHDVEPFMDEIGDRMIIRGDIIYQAV